MEKSGAGLCPLRRGQQAPGTVRTVQGVEFWGWGCQFHVEAEAPKHIKGVGGFMVDCRMTIETCGRCPTLGSGHPGASCQLVLQQLLVEAIFRRVATH
jgi:hypothetical protein